MQSLKSVVFRTLVILVLAVGFLAAGKFLIMEKEILDWGYTVFIVGAGCCIGVILSLMDIVILHGYRFLPHISLRRHKH